MIRKTALSAIAALALCFAGFAPAAMAQTATPTPAPCTGTYDQCISYPSGGLGGSARPTATPKPKPTTAANADADNVTATGGGAGGGNAIAFTGAESRVLGYAGVGLIGFGAVALAAARRRND